MTAGPFERNKVQPRVLNLGRVTQVEATRTMIAFLAEKGCLDGIAWETLGDEARETWVTAITEVYSEAARATSKDARQELAAYENLALLLHCRKCGAAEEEPCRDQRVSYIRPVRHPHQERMDDMEASL